MTDYDPHGTHLKGEATEKKVLSILAQAYGLENVERVSGEHQSDPLGFLDLIAVRAPLAPRFVQAKTNGIGQSQLDEYAEAAQQFAPPIVSEIWVLEEYEGWTVYRYSHPGSEWIVHFECDSDRTQQVAEEFLEHIDQPRADRREE